MGITREEAVDCISRAEVIDIVENVTEEWLKGDIGFMYPSLIKKIKGLPPVTLQPCEDAISRQALLNATVNKNSIWNKITDSKGDNLEAIISKLPPVTPQLSSELDKNSKKLEKDISESDCVSRADVLKLMQDNWHTHNGDWAMQESMDDIRALPPVTPQEPRKGKWISKPHMYGVTYCSECDFELKIDDTNYCPNCGAKMEERIEEVEE